MFGLFEDQARNPIRTVPDPILRMRAREVTEYDETLLELAQRMVNILVTTGGVGLSAPQVGHSTRMLMIRDFDAWDQGRALVLCNPEITNLSAERSVDMEGCLSLPGLHLGIERPNVVEARGYQPDGTFLEVRIDELQARIFQHEHDHLEGKLILDHVPVEVRRFAWGAAQAQMPFRWAPA